MLSNIGALKIPEVPRHLIVIGGGVIGLELGSVWRRLGAKVTVIEYAPTILPGNDEDIIREADRIFRKQGLEIHTGARVTGGRREGNRVIVDVEQEGAQRAFEADYVLVSIGRKPALTGIDAAALGLAARPTRRDPRRRPDAHEPPERLRDRRRHRRQAARAQGRGGGRGRRGSHRGKAGAHALPQHALGRVHLARDRDGGPHRARGEGQRPRVQGRQVPVLGERPRAHDGGDERLREVRLRRRRRTRSSAAT